MSAPEALAQAHPWLRRHDGRQAQLTREELIFDLVYAFALTQLSHQLWHHLTGLGLVQALVLWFALWLGWQHTCWVTNWFNRETPEIRSLLLSSMALALVMAVSTPGDLATRGGLFALAYMLMQVGRTACRALCTCRSRARGQLPADSGVATHRGVFLAGWCRVARAVAVGPMAGGCGV